MSRLIKASDIQSPDDPARKLAEKREKVIRDALIAMLLSLSGMFAGAVVIRLIERLDSRGLAQLLSSQEAQGFFIAGYQPIADTLLIAARQAANDNFMGLIAYDPLASTEALRVLRDQLAKSVLSGAQQAIQAEILAGLRSAASPELTAERLRAVISLAPQQAKAVANYRRLLQSGDATALRRALRDQRFDRRLMRAISGDTSLTGEQIDEMVAAYAKRSLEHRAKQMAATEAMQAAVSGIRDAHVQAVRSGRLYDSEVKRFWLTAGDELVCPVCSSVPLLNPNGIGVDQEYRTIEGPVLEPVLHPWCRCSERYVTNMSRLTQQPFPIAA
jgi:hypothetical protein